MNLLPSAFAFFLLAASSFSAQDDEISVLVKHLKAADSQTEMDPVLRAI